MSVFNMTKHNGMNSTKKYVLEFVTCV